jgi:hypothetical protein
VANTDDSAIAAKLALAEITFASFVIPECVALAGLIFENQCDPELIIRTGLEWLSLVDQLDVAKTDLDGVIEQVTAEQWSGQDRTAFEGHIGKYEQELFGVQILSTLTGVGMMVTGVILYIFVVVALLFASALALLAATILVCAAAVVTEPAVPVLEGWAAAVVSAAGTVLNGLAEAAAMVANSAAGMITGSMAADVGVQLMSGNFDVGGDLLDATIDGLDNVLWGLAARVERDYTRDSIASTGRHAAPTPAGGWLLYGTGTQDTPYSDSDGDTSYGPGGFVDHVHGAVPDFNR